jgi:hypothetical protein
MRAIPNSEVICVYKIVRHLMRLVTSLELMNNYLSYNVARNWKFPGLRF